MQTIILNQINSINKAMNDIYYNDYKAQRDKGVSHKNTVINGTGNTEFLERYIVEKSLN